MDRKRFALVLLALSVAMLASSNHVFAQTTTTGDVTGVVTDPSDAIVPAAKVSLKDIARGATQEATTNKDGVYHFSLLLPGNYSLTVTATGFQNSTRQVEVSVGQVTSADVRLTLGPASQTVIVTEQTTPLIQVDNGNVASTITEKQAANIPNPGNDLTYMAQIAPGSVMNTAGGGLGNFSSFGISALSNLFTMNGMDTNDPFLNLNDSGATNLLLGQNEVQEVSIVTNGYSGEYGGLAGANINYITRSGTNGFHGRATWFWNGRYLNANNWFNNANGTPRSFVNANQYGGDIGGPIKKDKLFFYFNAEGLYLVIPTSSQVLVPSPQLETAVQNNINATFGANSTIAGFYQNMFNLYNGAPGINRAKDNLDNHGCSDGSETLINAVAGTTFGTGGTPCALSFFSNVSNKTHEHLEAGRVDWNVTNRDRFFTRIQHDRGLQASITDPINSLFNTQSDQPEWQGQAQEVHTFAGGAVNQVVISGQFYSAIFGNANPSATFAAFPTTLLFASGQLSNLGGFDFDFPQGRRVTQFQVSDDFTKTFGTHTFKTGAKYRRNWITNTDYSVFATGLVIPITFDAFFWGGADPVPANAAKGNFTELQQSFPTALSQPFAVYTVGGFVEDDWKVKQNLTLTLAFRLDHASNAVCFTRCFANPVVQFPDLSTDPNTPYNQLMAVNQKQFVHSLTAIEPQPRIGFAWQPHFWGMRDTVVRGGFGIFYDNFPGVLLDNISENPPNDPFFIVTNGTISSPSDPASLFASSAASNAGFQTGFKNGQSFNEISANVPGFTAPSLGSTQTHAKIPHYQKWSLGVEHQFGQNTSLSVQYVGNHGIHIFFLNNGINGFDPTGTFTDLPTAPPNPNFATVSFGQSIGVSNYNGLTTSFTHRYKSGLVQINYTYSHAMDMVSNSGVVNAPFAVTFFGASNNSVVEPEDPLNPRRFNYGNADQDIRHSLNANYIWELPIKQYVTRGHGPDRLLKGWDVNGSVFLRSGFPYTLVDLGTSNTLAATNYGATVFGTELAPGGTGVNCAAQFGGSGIVQPSRGICLNPADFSTSPTGFGNVTRNTIRGPYYFNSDFSLMKHTPITERVEFVLGAQFYNVFNHPNFDAPVLNTSDGRFGQVIRTVSSPTTIYGSVLGADASPRLVQLKLQLVF
jgi:hypothetical protein